MTSAEYQALAIQAGQDTVTVEATTAQVLLRGIVAAAEAYDHMAPLPPMPDYRARSWEPAARHYRDLNEEERAEQ